MGVPARRWGPTLLLTFAAVTGPAPAAFAQAPEPLSPTTRPAAAPPALPNSGTPSPAGPPLPNPGPAPATSPPACGSFTFPSLPDFGVPPTTGTTRLVPPTTGTTTLVPTTATIVFPVTLPRPLPGARPPVPRGFTCGPGPDGILGTADDVLIPLRADTGAGGGAEEGPTSVLLLGGGGLLALLAALGVHRARRPRP